MTNCIAVQLPGKLFKTAVHLRDSAGSSLYRLWDHITEKLLHIIPFVPYLVLSFKSWHMETLRPALMSKGGTKMDDNDKLTIAKPQRRKRGLAARLNWK